MPTYEYACTACGEHLEVVQSFTDTALTECPACQGRLRKVFSAVGIVFKGSGFYKTDSRSGGSAAKPEPAKSEPAKADAAASGPTTATDSGATSPAPSGGSTTPAPSSGSTPAAAAS